MMDSARPDRPKSLIGGSRRPRNDVRARPSTTAGLALALIGAVATTLLIVPSGASAADRNACTRYGDVGAAKLTRKHARRATTCFINRERRSHGRKGLNKNWRLIQAARRHSNNMARTGCFAHQCPGEAGPQKRLQRSGYFRGARRWAYGENIAWGKRQYATPRKIVQRWMHSPGHRAIMLSSNYREVGVGFAKTNGGRGYYTADFGMAAG